MGKVVKLGSDEKVWRIMKMGRNVLQVLLWTGKYRIVDFLQGVAQGCALSHTSSINYFNAFVDDMMVAGETAKQGGTVREDTESGLIIADEFVAISEHLKYCRNKSTKL